MNNPYEDEIKELEVKLLSLNAKKQRIGQNIENYFLRLGYQYFKKKASEYTLLWHGESIFDTFIMKREAGAPTQDWIYSNNIDLTSYPVYKRLTEAIESRLQDFYEIKKEVETAEEKLKELRFKWGELEYIKCNAEKEGKVK